MTFIREIKPPTEEQIRSMRAHVQDCWNRYASVGFHVYASNVHRVYPQAELADKLVWDRVFGGSVPRPINEDDPAVKRREQLRKLKALGDAPTDPSKLNFWLHQIESNRIHSGVETSYRSAEDAIRQAHSDMASAMEQRDRWHVHQAMAKANSIPDEKARQEALDATHDLEVRLSKAREAEIYRLKNPAPAEEAPADADKTEAEQ